MKIWTHFASLSVSVFCAVAASAQGATERCNLSPADIYRKTAPHIVQVVTFGVDPYRVSGRVAAGTGSGILLEPRLVLTNYHVVQNSTLIGVQTETWSGGAVLIGGDPALDIALLVTDPYDAPDTPGPEFGVSQDLEVGQPVFVLGYPLGIGKSIAAGIVSGLDRKIPLNTVSWTTRYIQTDAAVSGGNSGGALVDSCGDIVGLVTLRSSHASAENLGFALPSDNVLPIIEEIIDTGHVSRPWHGLYGQMMTPLIAQILLLDPEQTPNGFLVETVEPGSAADIAGIRGGLLPITWGNIEVLLGGDIITEVDGRAVADLDTALDIVSSLGIGTSVKLKVWREGEFLDMTARIEERPVLEQDLRSAVARPRTSGPEADWRGGTRNP